MGFGINLPGVNYYTPAPALIDRMRLGGDAAGKFTTAPYDPATMLPTGAGNLARVIPFDPGTHDYVIRFDGSISRFVVNGAVKQPVISGNRATFTASLADDGYAAQMTMVAGGPVTRMELVRADHEAALDAGEIFHPDFLARLAPFRGRTLRALDWHGTNVETWPTKRPLPGDHVFQDSTGAFPHEFSAMLAAKLGMNLWPTFHHLMPDAQALEALHGMDSLGGSAQITPEWSNEIGWTFHRTWIYAQAAARYNLASPSVWDMLRYYGFRAGSLANLAASVSKRFKINLSAQPSGSPDRVVAAILAGWDESHAPRSLIGGFANEGYIGFNYPASVFSQLLALQAANDTAGFYTLARSMIPALAASHKAAATAAKVQGIPYKVYEFNASIYSQAPAIVDPTARAAFIKWIAPLVHSDVMADIIMQAGQAALDAGAVEANIYQMAGAGSQYGFWGLMPHICLPTYPLYDRLMKAAPSMQVASDSLAAISADLAAVAARLSAFASSAPPLP